MNQLENQPLEQVHNPLYTQHKIKACEIFDLFEDKRSKWNLLENQKKAFYLFLYALEQKRLSLDPIPPTMFFNKNTINHRKIGEYQIGRIIYEKVINNRYKLDHKMFFESIGYDINNSHLSFMSTRKNIEHQKHRWVQFIASQEEYRLSQNPISDRIECNMQSLRQWYVGKNNIGDKIYFAVGRSYNYDRPLFFKSISYNPNVGSIRFVDGTRNDVERQKRRWQRFIDSKEKERLGLKPIPKRIGFNAKDIERWQVGDNKVGTALYAEVIHQIYKGNWQKFFANMGFNPNEGTVRKINRYYSFAKIYARDLAIKQFIKDTKGYIKQSKSRSPQLLQSKYSNIYQFFCRVYSVDGNIDWGFILTTYIKSPLLISTFKHHHLKITGDMIGFKNISSSVYKGKDISNTNFSNGMAAVDSLNPEEIYIQEEESEEIQQLQEQQLNQYYEALHQCSPEEQDLMKQFSEGKIEIDSILHIIQKIQKMLGV